MPVAASNVPVAENGVLIVEKYDANNVHQMWSSIAADKIWTRRYTGGVWQTWQQIYPMDVPMGLAINNATAKSAPVNADKFPFWDSVSGLLREWTYGNMLTALNALYQSGSAALTALTTLGTGANGYLKNTGGTYSWATPGSDIQTFNASGTWTKPSGAYTLAQIEVWGPGGSGGAGGTDAGGGGGGGYSLITIPLTLLGATETVTVGTGGAAKAATGVGNPGSGNSSLGTWVIAGPGLAGGETLGAGIGVAGGTGGTGFTETGGQGAGANSSDSGIYFGSATVRGAANGGGSSKAGSVNALLSATTPINLPAIYGGQGGNGATGANGTAGSAPGGGGGACSSGTSGAGANGRVRITCY